jgi:nucleoside 2-deoxyribosyltransferase
MNQIRYETKLSNVDFKNLPSIFLAGPTVRGHQTHLLPSWRDLACEHLEVGGFRGNVIIPEFTDHSKADKGNEEWIVPWEYEGLCRADAILFWIPRTKELIGLNTNFEFGYWLAASFGKIVYGRPKDSYRNKYLDIMYLTIRDEYSYKKISILDNLEETCKHAHILAEDFFLRNSIDMPYV